MKPIEFKGHNTVFAKDQKEYLPLPAHVTDDAEGVVTTCWELTWKERLIVLFTGKVWWSQFTFHSPLQPQLPQVVRPTWVPAALGIVRLFGKIIFTWRKWQ